MNRKRRRAASQQPSGTGTSAPSTGFRSRTVQKLFAAAKDELNAGRAAEAVALCDRALAKQPQLASALNLKGVALDRMGRHEEGIELIRHSIRLRSDVAAFHSDLGIALINIGEIENAVTAFREAIRLRHDFAQAHCNLGLALKMLGAIDESVTVTRTAIALNPSLAEAHNNLAFALTEQRNLDEAVEAARKAIALRPRYPEAHNNLGNALRAQGKLELAVESYMKSIELMPSYTHAHYNLAYTYEQWNRLDEAEAAAIEGLRIAPNHPGINLVAAICERRAGNPKKALERLSRFSTVGADSVTGRAVHFELGQLHDRSGDADTAMYHFTTAKRAQATTWEARVADKGLWPREIDALAKRFTSSWIQSWTSPQDSDIGQHPIFVVGFPRSGNTLLGQILDGHPQLQTLLEQPHVNTLVNSIAKMPDGYPDALGSLDQERIQTLRSAYFSSVAQYIERQPGSSVVDELPLNIVRIGPISRIFPGARIILVIRHPCDVCLSCFMQNFLINEAMANFFSIEEAAEFYASVMNLWRQYEDVLSLNVHRVRYEDLVENFEPEVRRMLNFIGVAWDSGVLNHAENARGRANIKTPSYNQVAEPIYTRAKFRWHRYRKALTPAMDTLAPFIEYFGYTEG
jgi:tetratricopeptide (TPR) repeat protein